MRVRDASKIDINWGIEIPMRDGVILNATIYLPTGENIPQASITTITPYISDSVHERGMYFASKGFPFVIVDSRGRGNSGGLFRPMIQEARDGHDVVEWVAQQSFCNGKVAMWGGSYCGYNQWATAKELPPHLATIAPAASVHPGVDFPSRNNVFYPYAVQWLLYTSGNASQRSIFNDKSLWSSTFRRWHKSGLPFRQLDKLFNTNLFTFQEWLDHPELDDYWDEYVPDKRQYRSIDFPILTITGIYDDDQPGALEYYKNHVKFGSPSAKSSHYLVIGPWDHSGTRTPKREFGGIELGESALLDIQELHVQWYIWTMGDGSRPDFLKDRVSYYVTGAEEWRYANSLEEVTDHTEDYYLVCDGMPSDVFSSGSLLKRPARSNIASYQYDPIDTSGPEVEAETAADGADLTDQSVTMALRGKALVYHSEPFEKSFIVSGFFKLRAWISINRPDTDFYLTVYDISPGGNSVRLSTDVMRARYRDGLRSAKLIDSDEPLEYIFDKFTFVSRKIGRGHRIRLVISPIGRIVDSTFWQKNYNSGNSISEDSEENGLEVAVSLFQDPEHRSVLGIPIGR